MTAPSPRLEGSHRRTAAGRPLGVPIAAAVLGIGALLLASALPESSIPTAFSPQWWPQLLAVSLIALGVAGVVTAFRPGQPETPGEGETWSLGRVAGVILLVLAYLILWPLIGYTVATAIITVALSAFLGARGWRGLLLFPALVTGSFVLFFDLLLGVPL